MEINQLITIVKKKLTKNIIIQDIEIIDKSFLHKGHLSNEKDKFHLKLDITSLELKEKKKIYAYKIIHRILSTELKKYIHSIQISIR